MATDRPENTESTRSQDEQGDALVTYERPAAVDGRGAVRVWFTSWPILLLAVGGLFTVIALWSWSAKTTELAPGQRLQLAERHTGRASYEY